MVEKLRGDEFKTELVRRRLANLVLKGNTYAKRTMIAELGGIWDSAEKAWLMPDVASMQKVGAVQAGDHYEIPKGGK